MKDSIIQFGNDAKDVFKVLAPLIAFIGIVGYGMIQTGSALPIISKIKRDNPDMAHNIMLGMIALIAAGTISSLIVYS